jgi:hypothetical protein
MSVAYFLQKPWRFEVSMFLLSKKIKKLGVFSYITVAKVNIGIVFMSVAYFLQKP